MISFDGVSKSWGANQVLRSLNFEIAAGEKVSIIGPSGSGKTVLSNEFILEGIRAGEPGVIAVFGFFTTFGRTV